MEWQASATAPAVHHEHCDIPLQVASLVKALQVDSSSFTILTGSSIFFLNLLSINVRALEYSWWKSLSVWNGVALISNSSSGTP